MDYLANAFSLQMLFDFDKFLSLDIVKVDQAFVKNVKPLFSAIGHADTARILSDLLGRDIPMVRQNITLGYGDTLYVAQLVGGRLPEGSTTLPDGFEFVWYMIKLR